MNIVGNRCCNASSAIRAPCDVNNGLERTRSAFGSDCATILNAASKSNGGCSSLNGLNDKLIDCADCSADRNVTSEIESHSTAMRFESGNASTKSSSCFAANSCCRKNNPVTLEPGCARLLTYPRSKEL